MYKYQHNHYPSAVDKPLIKMTAHNDNNRRQCYCQYETDIISGNDYSLDQSNCSQTCKRSIDNNDRSVYKRDKRQNKVVDLTTHAEKQITTVEGGLNRIASFNIISK